MSQTITETSLNTETLVAGNVVSATKAVPAGEYFPGQVLGMLAATLVYGDYDATGTYDVLNVTDIPVGSVIIIDTAFAGVSSGTAVLSADILYVNDGTDEALAIAARDAVAGLENIRAICVQRRTLGSAGFVQVYISGSEVKSSGLVDGSGDPLTVDDVAIESAQSNGIIIKA